MVSSIMLAVYHLIRYQRRHRKIIFSDSELNQEEYLFSDLFFLAVTNMKPALLNGEFHKHHMLNRYKVLM